MNQSENQDQSNRGQEKRDGENDRKRKRNYRSTGGKAPRKCIGPKEATYRKDIRNNVKTETGAQTYPSTSDAQVQKGGDTKDVGCQTNFHSRFYAEPNGFVYEPGSDEE